MKKIFLVMTLALIAIVTGCDRVQNIVAPEEMVEKPAELRVKEVMEELQELQKEFWDMGIPMVVPTPEIVAKDRSNSHFVYSNKEGVWVESLGMAPILLEKPLWATENLGLPGVAVAENITTERRGTTDYIVVLSQKPNAKAAIAHLYVGGIGSWNHTGATAYIPTEAIAHGHGAHGVVSMEFVLNTDNEVIEHHIPIFKLVVNGISYVFGLG